ncbi:MAG: hypothetical protein C4311_00755 [Chloroflexota bacterium]
MARALPKSPLRALWATQYRALARLLGRERDGYDLALLLQLSEDAVFSVDPRTGQVLDANSSAVELTGHTLAELRQLSLSDLFAQTVPPSLLTQLTPGTSRAFRNVSLRTRTERGPVRVDVRLTLVTAEGPALIIARDLTASRRLEQALARVDEQLTTLAALMALAAGPALTPEDDLKRALHLIATICGADAVALYHDGGQRAEDGRHSVAALPLRAAVGLASMLPPTCELQQEAPAVGSGSNLPSPIFPSPAWLEALSALGWASWQVLPLASGLLFIGRRSPGADVASTALLAAIGTALEALLGRMAREALQAERAARADDLAALNQTLLDAVNDGVLVLDQQGVIRACNRIAARVLGYEPPELIGQASGDVLVARQNLAEAIQAALAGTPSGTRLEVTLLSRDAHEVPAMLGTAPLRGPGRGALILIQDLSDRRALEDQHRDLDRLAFLGEMSAIFAHEIRNPLAAISAGVQYIAGKLPANDPLQESIALILAESRRLNQLLADILTVARASEPRLAPCPLHEVLDDVLARRAGEMDRLGIQVVRNYAPDLPPCLGDRPKLEQVFTNLIANAIQAMSNGGTLSITLKRASETTLQVEVADTGPGIPEAVQKRIFDPFFTTRRTGTGLGLTIARRIVGQHNGSLSLRSWEGVGTIFTVTLPAAER